MSKSARRPAAGRKPVLLFLLRCVVYWAAALGLVSRFSAIENAGISLTIVTLQGMYRMFGQSLERVGNSIATSRTSVEIVADCSPHMPFLIFAAVILAFPSTWRQRLLGLAFGALVIHLFNVVRIVTLLWVLTWRSSWFEFVHVYLWQTGTILIVFVTFALWIRRCRSGPARHDGGSRRGRPMKFLLWLALWSVVAFVPAWFLLTPWQHALASIAGRLVAPPGAEIEFTDLQVYYPLDIGVFVALCLASTWAPRERRLRVDRDRRRGAGGDRAAVAGDRDEGDARRDDAAGRHRGRGGGGAALRGGRDPRRRPGRVGRGVGGAARPRAPVAGGAHVARHVTTWTIVEET